MHNTKKQNGLYSRQYNLWATNSDFLKKTVMFFLTIVCLLLVSNVFGQKLQLNDLGYFETQGVNVFVYSNQYNGFFFDEKTAGITAWEIINELQNGDPIVAVYESFAASGLLVVFPESLSDDEPEIIVQRLKHILV